jgi:hypothetical protein
MSDLKNLLREAKANLQDLESLLQKTKSNDQDEDNQYILGREELQKHFDEIFRILKTLPENLRLEEGAQGRGGTRSRNLQSEEVLRIVEQCFRRVEAACETNLKELSEFIEDLHNPPSTRVGENPVSSSHTPSFEELLSKGLVHFENNDYDACLKVMRQALDVDPTSSEARDLLVQVQNKLEDQRLEEELLIHVENLKKEAMDQFDKEQYQECMRTFKFLCELEPNSRTLRDYFELSRQKVEEVEVGGSKSNEAEDLSEISPENPVMQDPVVGSATTPSNIVSTTHGPSMQDITSLSMTAPREQGSQESGHLDSIGTQPHHRKNSYIEIIQDSAVPTAQEEASTVKDDQKIKRLIFGGLVGALLLFSLIFGLRRTSGPGKSSGGRFEVQSEPASASVFIDGQLKGQTHLLLEPLSDGNHDLRIELDGYAPLAQKLTLAKGQAALVSVRLEKLNNHPSDPIDLQKQIRALYDQGRLIEANRSCETILEKAPQDSFALGFKSKIRNRLLQQSKSAIAKGQWEEARLALESTLEVVPEDYEAARQLKMVKTKLKNQTVATQSGQIQARDRTQELHQQISVALNAGNYFPPNSGNALDLINQLNSLAPADLFAKEKLEQIQRDFVSQAQKKMQAKDYESAKAIMQQLQVHFPESPELRNLRENLRTEEAKLTETWSPFIQRAESAMTSGRYVTPVNENAFVYCTRVLAIDPQNQRALSLRKDALSRAVAQAKEFSQAEKFDQARDVYSSLMQLSASETRLPLTVAELKNELEKLEFTAYPVVHDHAFGSCTGRLRFNAYVIAFIPTGSSKEGFSVKLSEIELGEPGDKLKIQVKNKTYRYEANLVDSKEENRNKIRLIHQRLADLMAGRN